MSDAGGDIKEVVMSNGSAESKARENDSLGTAIGKGWNAIPLPVKTMIGVLITLSLLVTGSKFMQDSTPRYDATVVEGAKRLMRDAQETARLSQAMQQNDPVNALSNTQLAIGHIQGLRRFLADADIERITGVRVHRLMNELEDRRDDLLQVFETSE